jgi:CBS domain-containing protein
MPIVGDVMSRNLLTVEQETTLVAAAAAMTERRVGAVLVVSDGRLTGILTERDVLRAVAAGDVGGQVAEWMTRNPETIDADESTQQAGVVMIHGGFRHLPVLDEDAPIGIVSIRDLMRVVLDDVSPRGV